MTICLQSQYKLEKQSLGPNLMEAAQNNITSLAQLQQLRFVPSLQDLPAIAVRIFKCSALTEPTLADGRYWLA